MNNLRLGYKWLMIIIVMLPLSSCANSGYHARPTKVLINDDCVINIYDLTSVSSNQNIVAVKKFGDRYAIANLNNSQIVTVLKNGFVIFNRDINLSRRNGTYSSGTYISNSGKENSIDISRINEYLLSNIDLENVSSGALRIVSLQPPIDTSMGVVSYEHYHKGMKKKKSDIDEWPWIALIYDIRASNYIKYILILDERSIVLQESDKLIIEGHHNVAIYSINDIDRCAENKIVDINTTPCLTITAGNIIGVTANEVLITENDYGINTYHDIFGIDMNVLKTDSKDTRAVAYKNNNYYYSFIEIR